MNNILQRFHRYALSRIVWTLSILVGAIFALGWSLAPDNIFTKILAPLTSAAAVGGVFLFSEKLVRQNLWKIAYPELYFHGTWQGYTEYCEPIGLADEVAKCFQPFRKEHNIRFKQDCSSIIVDYDETDAYHGWNSSIATLFNETGKIGLRYAYEVKYRQGAVRDELLPKSSKGLEELFVIGPEIGKKPKRVTGFFAHTSDGPKPIYSGTVAFERHPEVPGNSPPWIVQMIVNYWLKPPGEE